ncbi:MAG: glutamyl-tRNA reductase [Bacilli bacterium]
MHFVVLSMNYESTPVSVREQFTFTDQEMQQFVLCLLQSEGIEECMVVATCNRTEIYAVVREVGAGTRNVLETLAVWYNVSNDCIRQSFSIWTNAAAMHHVFSVCAGLKSLVIGETQILGQVRDGYLCAQGVGGTKRYLNRLIQQALRAAKRIHSELKINDSVTSVAACALTIVDRLYGRDEPISVGVIGAGETAQLVIRHLNERNIRYLGVANRTEANIQRLESVAPIKAYRMDEMRTLVQHVDVLISTVHTKSPVVTTEHVRRMYRTIPKLFIDLGVPRNIATEVGEVKGALLYAIDDLQRVIASNVKEREQIALQAENFVVEEVHRFDAWLRSQEVVPLIAQIHAKAKQIETETMDSVIRKMPTLSDREYEIIQKHMRSVQNQWLSSMVRTLKGRDWPLNDENERDYVFDLLGLERSSSEI